MSRNPFGWMSEPPKQKPNPLLEPVVDGDEIDDLVNWQIENGMDGRE